MHATIYVNIQTAKLWFARTENN